MVWARLTNIRPDKYHPARHRQGSKKTRKTEEEVGGHHQKVDRPFLLRDTKGGKRQAEVETTGYKVIGGAPTKLRVKVMMITNTYIAMHSDMASHGC